VAIACTRHHLLKSAEHCGEPIGLQRLLVLPAAEHCAACQAAVERHIRDAIGRGA